MSFSFLRNMTLLPILFPEKIPKFIIFKPLNWCMVAKRNKMNTKSWTQKLFENYKLVVYMAGVK